MDLIGTKIIINTLHNHFAMRFLQKDRSTHLTFIPTHSIQIIIYKYVGNFIN